jgi:hypothetical protein
MALQSQAVGAEGILALIDIAVWEELTTAATTQRALLAATHIEESEQGYSPPRHTLQQRAREEVEDMFYELFHVISFQEYANTLL